MHHRFSAASAIVNNNVVLYFNMCCFSSLSGKAVFSSWIQFYFLYSLFIFLFLFLFLSVKLGLRIYIKLKEKLGGFSLALHSEFFFSSELFFWVNCSLLCGKTRQCLLVFLFRNCHVCKDNYRVFVVIFCSPAQSQHCLTKHNLSFVHTKLVFTWLLIEF